MNIRPLESLTKEELIELIRHERWGEPVAWQPIETAPKDGTTILVYFRQHGAMTVFWGDHDYDHTSEYATWLVEDHKHGPYPVRGYSKGDDTHWMPLPSFPHPAEPVKVPSDDDSLTIAYMCGYHDGKRSKTPEGWQLVPKEPSDEMKKAGCQVPLNKAARHNACYKAMLAAAPQPDHIPDVGKMIEPTDTQMLDWLIKNDALICHSATNNLYEVWFDIDNVETGKTAREAIINAMRGEK